jgi:hypothetical protein
MNITDVVNDIKFSQGLNEIALPYKAPVENVIQEILKITVREWSELKPYIRECETSKELLYSPSEFLKKNDIYILPSDLTITRVKTAWAVPCSSQYQTQEAMTNTFTVGTPFVGFGSYYPQDITNATMTGAAINKYAGVTSQQPTTRYLGNNRIKFFNFPDRCAIKITAKCYHEPSLETIPDTQYLSFVELATLDVQRTLYNNLKNMENVGSAFKDIQTKIGEWSGAEQAQKDWLKNAKERFHIDDIAELVQFF